MALDPVQESAGLTTADVVRIAKEEGVDPARALAHWQQETSGGKNVRVSPDGAMGHFQVLPSTFKDILPEGDINNPQDNARAGIRYMRQIADKFPGNLEAQAASYFAGPGRVAQYGGDVSKMMNLRDGGGVSVPDYVKGIMGHYARFKDQFGQQIVEFNGKLHHFPADATDAEIAQALDALYPTASQADVRKGERTAPLAEQDADERVFDAALKAWMKTPAGQAFTPNLNMSAREQFTKATGRPDPMANRDAAEIQHARETGDVVYGNSTAYNVAKPLAGIAGFTMGGPVGATLGEAGVRALALVSNLQKAVEAGAIDEDRADEILWTEMSKGTAEDALFNFGVPLLTNIALKIPGAKPFLDKVIARISAKFTPSAIEGEQSAAAVAKRMRQAPDDLTKQAVGELSGRMKDGMIPTPGQVTGEASTWEATARKASPQTFAKQQTALEGAAEGLRQDSLGINPTAPSLRQGIGQSVLDTMSKTEKALKDRLRPTFQAADDLGVSVDLTPVAQRAKAALAEDAAAPAGKLEPRERAELQKIVSDIESTGKAAVESQPVTSSLVDASGKPIVKGATAAQDAVPPVTSPAGTLDFISRRKETMRELPDYKPSKYYETVVGDLTKAADAAYVNAARTAGRGNVAQDLLKARADYREFMSTAYDGATETALKRTPEDVGRVFWQGGNTTEIGQFQKLLNIAQRESALGNSEARDNMRRMTLGFLQEAVPNLQAAANWSKALAESPLKRDTWNALTSTPGGQQLKATMDLLEKSATIASRDSSALMAGHTVNLFVQRAAAGGAGYSSVTGAVRPGIVLSAFSLTGITRLAATAYTQGDRGVANLIMRALRANSAATAVSTKVLQQLHDYAAKNDVSLDDEEQQ